MKAMMRAALMGSVVLASTSHPAQAQALYLTCIGTGTAAGESSAGLQASDSRPPDEAKIEILRYQGRIRMPRSILSGIRSGKDGWIALEKLSMGREEIVGKAAVGFFNSLDVRIDRKSSTLSITGKSRNFAGRCRTDDPAEVKQPF